MFTILVQLKISHDRFSDNFEILQALVSFNRDAGNGFAADRFMKKLQNIQ